MTGCASYFSILLLTSAHMAEVHASGIHSKMLSSLQHGMVFHAPVMHPGGSRRVALLLSGAPAALIMQCFLIVAHIMHASTLSLGCVQCVVVSGIAILPCRHSLMLGARRQKRKSQHQQATESAWSPWQESGQAYLAQQFIMETYLDGPEVDVDIALSQGEIIYGAVTDNWPTIEPYFNETGSNCPSQLPNQQQVGLTEQSICLLMRQRLDVYACHVCMYACAIRRDTT